jgi:hypothetical protein
MAGKLPSGSSSSSSSDGRPRAQVSFQGEDEFSLESLEPERKKTLQTRAELVVEHPGVKEEIEIHELKPTNDNGIISFLRKIFAR